MMDLTKRPKFEKRIHHVVPVSWQNRFGSPGNAGPYYKNVLTGQNLNAQGPGKKMAEEYAYIVFDEAFRPSDALEDHISGIENKAINGIDHAIATCSIDDNARVDIAYFLAIQACRYPELFQRRLDLARYLAIALQARGEHSDVQALNASLQDSGMLPGAKISPEDFDRLRRAPEDVIANELDAILSAHGYESFFNPEMILSGALPTAEHLLALHWELISATNPSFALCDRPVPPKIGYGFRIGLSANLALVISEPQEPVTEGTIQARPATTVEISEINSEIRNRAREWICGPGAWVHQL